MRIRRAAVPVTLAAAALAAPAAAQGAAIAVVPQKPCYGAGEKFIIGGLGFTPNAGVAVTRDGQRIGTSSTDPLGRFNGTVGVPQITAASQTSTYTATDTVNPLLTASLPLRLSRLEARVRPSRGNPTRVRRITARGFTAGSTLYAHVVRGRSRNLRIGRLKGACHTISARRRIFRRSRVGVYKVQFDTFRRYRRMRSCSGRTPPRRCQALVFTVRVFRVFRARSAGLASVASTGETWTRVR